MAVVWLGRVPTPVWSRAALAVGQRLVGPAIVEQPDTTTVVYPGQALRVDASGSLLIETGRPGLSSGRAESSAGPGGPSGGPGG